MNKKLKKILGCTEFYVFLLIVVVGLLIQARSGQFFTSNNIVDIASAMIVPGIFAVGIFMVLVSGGMDVSFPALASLSAYATTKLLWMQAMKAPFWFPWPSQLLSAHCWVHSTATSSAI